MAKTAKTVTKKQSKKPAVKKPAKPARKPGVPRAEDEAKVLAYVQKNPGSTAEGIRAELGLPPERTSYILSQLVKSGKIKGKGTTRAMAYTAISAAPPKAKKGKTGEPAAAEQAAK